MEYEKQLNAMKMIMEALAPLDTADQKAVWGWVSGQLGLSKVEPSGASAGSGGMRVAATGARQGTVNVVAQKLGVTSARELLLVAATYLTLYQSKDTFTKDELVACAKEARSWKSAYSNQMAMNIKRMCDSGMLFEKARDVFSLSDESLNEVEGRLS